MTAEDLRNLHVLVVDDSAIVRRVASALLEREPGITTSIAADPIVAMHCVKLRRPDVILLDLEMPRMDGLTFLRKIMAEEPIPVVICSALTKRGSETALRALEAGAVDVINKPAVGVRAFLEESAIRLVDAVRAAGRAYVGAKLGTLRDAGASTEPLLSVTTDKVVAIGASTGGTEAVRRILETMPADCPGIVVVQHMPEVFTAAFAERMNQSCAIEVREAAMGDRVAQGRALIAPGNLHVEVYRSGAYYVVRTHDGPLVSRHRPSVNVLFESVAKCAGTNAVGVILTGMGDDGASGLLSMKERGAGTIAQDEETCVVFGMPKEAIGLGAVDEVLPLDRVSASILRRCRSVRATSTRLSRGRHWSDGAQKGKV